MKAYTSQYTLFESESRLCEISLAIPVPDTSSTEVRQLRQQAYTLSGRTAEPARELFIPVCSFLLFEHLAYDVFTHFRRSLEAFPPFNIYFDSVFSDSTQRSLSLGLEAGYPFMSMINRINNARTSLKIRTNYSQAVEPRIPLFRANSKAEFDSVKGALLGKYISGGFNCSQVRLIKFDLLNRTHCSLGTLNLNSAHSQAGLSKSSRMEQDLLL